MSRQPEHRDPTGLTREELLAHPTQVLKAQGDGTPRVLRIDLPGGPVVLKSWEPRSRLLAWWARRVLGREVRNYRLLQGCPGIPRLVAELGPAAFAVEWIDGEPVRRQVAPERLVPALDDLEQILAGLHRRRFVHLDLHQRRNILVDRQGKAWIVDLGQGLDCSRGWLAPLLFRPLAAIDRRAALKFRARYAPETLPAERREELVARHGQRSARRWLKPVRRALRRLVGGAD